MVVCWGTHGHCEDIVNIASPEDDTRGVIGGLEFHTETCPHGVVGHGTDGRDEEGHLRFGLIVTC